MSLPSKGSRKVTVRDLEYRWHVRKKPTYGQAINQALWRVAIERSAPESRSILMVNLGLSRPGALTRAGLISAGRSGDDYRHPDCEHALPACLRVGYAKE